MSESPFVPSTCLSFDGTDDYVALPVMNVDWSQGLTIEAWARFEKFNHYPRIIDLSNGPAVSNIVLCAAQSAPTLIAQVYTGQGAPHISKDSALKLGEWVHLAMTIEPPGTGRIYVNGKLAQSGPVRIPESGQRAHNWIGRSPWPQDGYFQGQIGEVRIWKVPRSEAEVQRDMTGRLGGNEPGLLAYLPMDEGAGVARDRGPNGFHGTPNGATWVTLRPASPGTRPSSQSVSGSVNTAAAVTALAHDVVSLGGTTNSLRPGDRVVVIQMTGATIETTNDDKFGSITGYGGAGRYLWASVVSVSGQDVKLSEAPAGLDPKAGKVQLIRACSHAGDVTVSGRVEVAPWDGSAGGVIAIESGGTLDLDADIDASGKGFLGGRASRDASGSGPHQYAGPETEGAGWKGQGIAAPAAGHVVGRGPAASGGGGGSGENSGGGGGGNGGGGGRGGDEWAGGGRGRDPGGLGGRSLDATDRAFLGGGGGGGQQNNSQGSGGGSGGGIVLLRAQSITGAAGRVIRANGESARPGQADGAGGGGAGGTVILEATGTDGAFSIEAHGGNGGDAAAGHGPGGGGGGGTIRTRVPLAGTIKAAVDPGSPGKAGGDSRGAAAGVSGIIGPLTTRPQPLPGPGTGDGDQELTALRKRVTDLETSLGRCGDCADKLGEQAKRLDALEQGVVSAQRRFAEQDQKIAEADKKIAAAERDNVEQERKLLEQDKKIAELTAKAAGCGACETKLATQEQTIAELSRRIEELAKQLADKTPAPPTKPEPVDDLEQVEGIGPKIAEELKAAGIRTYKQLASTEVAELQKILKAGGTKYARNDPSSWPKQAQLIVSGKSAELKALQDSLRAGRTKS